MLENVAKITRVVLACGTVDLRKGIDGLSMIIGDKYKQNPFEISLLLLTVYSLTSIGIMTKNRKYVIIRICQQLYFSDTLFS